MVVPPDAPADELVVPPLGLLVSPVAVDPPAAVLLAKGLVVPPEAVLLAGGVVLPPDLAELLVGVLAPPGGGLTLLLEELLPPFGRLLPPSDDE